MRNHRLLLVLMVGLALLAGVSGSAQGQAPVDNTCPVLVEQALQEIGSNCDALDRNTACYGYLRVQASFQSEQPEDFFSAPADFAGLSLLRTIQTTPLDIERQEWGIAVMNVQANVPSSLPGQAVVFILFGDVVVENAVDPAQAYTPAEPVNVTVLTSANARSGPGTASNVIAGVPAGTVLPVDGLSADKAWVRALLDGSPVWISRDLVRPDVIGTLGELPVVTGSSRTPMQAFYFRAGVGGVECTEAPPSTLVIQGPDNVRVELNANGADIRIGSTIALFITPDNFLQIIALSGQAEVGGIVLPPGFTIFAPLSSDGRSITGPWTGFRPITPEELASLRPLENIPDNLLHYPLVLPTLGDIARTLAAISRPSSQLPAPPQTEPGAPTPTVDPAAPPTGAVDCTGFVPTSPLDAASVGSQAFYWNPASGVDGYRWVLLSGQGEVLGIIDTAPQTTSYVASLPPTFPTTLQWEVQALSGGQVVCTTYRVLIPLVGGGQVVTEEPSPEAECKARGGVWRNGECYQQ